MSPAQGREPSLRRTPVPLGPDPFVNTPLIALGPDEDGVERFWTSSVNVNVGALGLLVRADGRSRRYQFGRPHSCFYSAVPDGSTLWLCGDLSRIVRLDLTTGDYQQYTTGARPALVFQGMGFDPVTRRLLVVGYGGDSTDAVSFDTVSRSTVAVHLDVCQQYYQRASRAETDGTVTIAVEVPGVTHLRWDPVADTIADAGGSGGLWPPERPEVTDQQPDGGQPDGGDADIRWFARYPDAAWGVASGAKTAVVRWDAAAGTTTEICSVADCTFWNFALTNDRKVVAVSLYGQFSRYDGTTGALELSRRLPTDSMPFVDCLYRIDKDRVLGTSFISQRFWEADLATSSGRDCGRAAAGTGEVLRVAGVDDKVYLAIYTTGALVEYDPGQPARYPENPRLVAAPIGAMRPVAMVATDTAVLYASTREYARLGCVLTRYDTVSGEASYHPDPLRQLAIHSMFWHRSAGRLLVGTTIQADCRSCPPTELSCRLARIDPVSLAVLDSVPMPAGAESVTVHGLLTNGRLLCSLIVPGAQQSRELWFETDPGSPHSPATDELVEIEGIGYHLAEAGRPDLAVGPARLRATANPGVFVALVPGRVELWDMDRRRRSAVLFEDPTVYLVEVQQDSVLLTTRSELVVLDDILTDISVTN